jgi:hypothetical protein
MCGLAGESGTGAPMGFSRLDLLLRGQCELGNSPRWVVGGGEHWSLARDVEQLAPIYGVVNGEIQRVVGGAN